MNPDLYAALKLLALPPTSLMLAAVLGLLLIAFGLRGGGTALVTIAVLALYVLGCPYISTRLLASLEDMPTAQIPPPAGTGAIVVLAGDSRRPTPEYGGPAPGPLVLERLRYAAYLQRKTGLPILVSGGLTQDDTVTHAALMRESLSEDFRAIVRWSEARSTNTFENAKDSAAMLGVDGIVKVYLVTHAWHMPRAMAAFESAGLDVVPAPTAFTTPAPLEPKYFVPTAAGWSESYYGVHEWIGRIWYDIEYAVKLSTGADMGPETAPPAPANP
ncbi:MAG: hypothetical protein CMM50_18190 [Rhodospirillaceae bacterium]|nr:hypothetical protein [Rhodospirillaceae bacterium]